MESLPSARFLSKCFLYGELCEIPVWTLYISLNLLRNLTERRGKMYNRCGKDERSEDGPDSLER